MIACSLLAHAYAKQSIHIVYIWYGMRMNDEIRYDDKMHILQEYKLPYIHYTIQHKHTLCTIHTNTYYKYMWANEPHTLTHTHTHLLMVAMERDYFFLCVKKNIEFKEERTRDGSKCLSFLYIVWMSFAHKQKNTKWMK